ncbi:MAG: PEP/pyruvate-binding domain-containing protein [Candidatus Hermodarchaeota archaeon]
MIILNRNKFSIKKFVMGDKEKTSTLNPKGCSTILNPTKQNLRSKCSLDESQLIKLFDLDLKIEDIFNYPQDIKWAIEDNSIYILQSRPITTLREN